MKSIGITHCFILAGGIGSRLRPLTDAIPKVLVLVQGKPLLWYNLELARRYGVQTAIIGVGHRAQQIREYAQNQVHTLRVICSEEAQPLGTAGALKLAEKLLPPSDFIMMNGDELKDVDLAKVQRVHKKNNALATIALTRVQDCSGFGMVQMEGYRIVSFTEKPSGPTAGLINAGLYILSHEIFSRIPAGRAVSIEKNIFPRIAEEGKLFGCAFPGQWLPTDDLERLNTAEQQWRGFT